MFRKIKENPGTASLILTAFTLYSGILGYATAASYRAGYLMYFGISIDMVPFWPKISDFMIAPVIGVIYLVVMMIIAILAILLGSYLGYWSAKLMQKLFKRKADDDLPRVIDASVMYIVIAIFFVLSIITAYVLMPRFGENFARSNTQFTKLTNRDAPTLLIHQHDGVGVIKEYNPDSKEFSNSYEVIDLTNQKFERVTIKRNVD